MTQNYDPNPYPEGQRNSGRAEGLPEPNRGMPSGYPLPGFPPDHPQANLNPGFPPANPQQNYAGQEPATNYPPPYAGTNYPQADPYQNFAQQERVPTYPQWQTGNQPKRSKKGVIISLIILLVVAIAGVLIWFFLIKPRLAANEPEEKFVRLVNREKNQETKEEKTLPRESETSRGEIIRSGAETETDTAATASKVPESEKTSVKTTATTEQPTESQTEKASEAAVTEPSRSQRNPFIGGPKRPTIPRPAPSETESGKTELMEIAELAQTLNSLPGSHSFYFQYVGDNKYVFDGVSRIRTASTIKLFIMAKLFQMQADGSLDLNQSVTIAANEVVGGTGVISAMSARTFTVYDLIFYMMTYSDNTAGNVLTDLAGGLNAITSYAHSLGCTDTSMGRYFMQASDGNLQENWSSAKDMGIILNRIATGTCVGSDSDYAMLGYLGGSLDAKILSASLPTEATVYYKTGQLTGSRSECAIVQSGGYSYVICCLTDNGNEDEQIRQLGELAANVHAVVTR